MIAVGRDDVVASDELATLQLNDMFVLHATRQLRILTLLADAGANKQKLDATRIFLDELEDYDTAMQPGSATRKLLEMIGGPWKPWTE